MRRALLVATVSLVAATASADVVGMAFIDCPPGASTMSGSHGTASYCTPATCANDTECSTGPCRRAGLCVSETDYEQTLSAHSGGGTTTVHQVLAVRACSSDADCEGIPCVLADRCIEQGPMPDALRTGPSAGSACGCRAGSRGGAPLAWLALALLLPVTRRRTPSPRKAGRGRG